MVMQLAQTLDNKESAACRKDGNTNIKKKDKYKYKKKYKNGPKHTDFGDAAGPNN